MTVSLFDCPPFVVCNHIRDCYDGVEIRMLMEIAKDWNINYQIFKREDSPWAKTVDNVENGTSNLALCSPFLQSVAKRNLDMTVSYSDACLTFLVPKPKILPKETYVLQPLQKICWIIIIFVTLFVAFFCIFCSIVYKIFLNRKTGRKFLDFGANVMDSIRLVTLGSLKRFPSGEELIYRFILSSWCITSLLISTGYSGGFTSSFTTPRYSNPINSFKDMVDQNIYFGSPELETISYLTNSFNPHIVELSKNFIFESNPTVDKPKRVRRGNYAIMIKRLSRNFLTDLEVTSYGKKHLKVISECFLTSNIVWALNKNSPFIFFINRKLRGFIEHGFLNYWFFLMKYTYGMENTNQFFSDYVEDHSSIEVLNLDSIQGAFYVLVFGLGLAVVCFFGEIIYLKYTLRKFVL